MVQRKRNVTVYQCERCEHEWIPRDALADEQELPTICPKCKTPYWNKPRKEKKAKKPTKVRR
jgi:DNA replicative helicase MCM subunit Mcm2 (Cdc46/Mcm family)